MLMSQYNSAIKWYNILTDFQQPHFFHSSKFSKREEVQSESLSQKLQQTLLVGSGKAVQESSEALHL